MGAGVGYASHRDQPKDIRRRNALVGGATGAGIGALAGGLASPTPNITEVIQQGVDPARARQAQQSAGRMAIRNFIQNLPTGLPVTDEAKAEMLRGLG